MKLMQQTSLLERTVMPDGATDIWPDPGHSLNVALVYQDALTQEWADQVRDLIAQRVGEGAVRCTEWNISDLRQRNVFSEGVAALAKADAIVMAVYEAERLPAAIYLWVNVWLQERSGLPGALVALVGTSEASHSGSNETQRYLHAVASQGRLELILKKCDRSSAPTSLLRKDLMQWAKAA